MCERRWHADAKRRRWSAPIHEVLLRNFAVDVVAIGAVPRLQLVCNKVLAARGRLQRVGRLLRLLEAAHPVHRVLAREKGILAGAFNVAPPARVTDDVEDRGLYRGLMG